MTLLRRSAALAAIAVLVALPVPGHAGEPPRAPSIEDPASVLGTAEAPPVSTNALVCDGDGNSGRRVQLIYVRGDQSADRYGQMVGSFRTWASQMDDAINTAAQRSGATRHVRFRHDANCVPIVDNVVIPQGSMGSVDAITSQLQSRGYNRGDRKYIYWHDSAGCGLAFGNGGDDRAGADNPYNGGPHYAAVGTGCWTWQATAHEFLHTLGAVQRSAPHATAYGHCWDDQDIMCYNDGGVPNPPGGMVNVCGGDENQVDCNLDDYFNANPPAGSYLATRWNVARSLYLTGGGGTPGPSPVNGAVYVLTNGGSGKAIDVPGGGTADGVQLIQWSRHDGNNQRWRFTSVSGGWTLTNIATGKCLDVPGGTTTAGARLQQWTCNSTVAQRWTAQSAGGSAFTLTSAASGLVIQPFGDGTADNVGIVQGGVEGNAFERWTLNQV